MSALKESGTLPVGVEVDGKFHYEFTLRPRLVRDSVDVLEEDSRAQNNDAYRGVALIARQIESLGDLEPEQITTKLLLSMFDTDLAAIMEANSRLEGRLKNFRTQSKNTPASASGIGENRDPVA